MELGPIPVVQGYSAAKELPADFQLSAVLEVNGLAKSGDGSRSGGRRKQASAAQAEMDDVTIAGESQAVEEQAAEPTIDPQPGHINFFA
jgi:hypothetical protein